MEERSIEADFGGAIAELKKREPSRRFLLESRHLGAVLDVAALLGTGWRAVESRRGGKWLWHGCLWFERRVRHPEGDGEAVVRLGTSGFRLPAPDGGADMEVVPDGKDTEALLRGEGGGKPALAYLRTVEFRREEEGGLRFPEWEGDVPEWVLGPVDAELAECCWRNWNSFTEDLAWQTGGFQTQLPAGIYASEFNASMGCLADLLERDFRRDERCPVAKRLLARLVRTLAEDGYDPAGRAALEGYGDGRTLEKLLAHWLGTVPPGDGAGARFLAYALERTDKLIVPYSARGWTMLACVLREAGFRKESVLAGERALACPDAEKDAARNLFGEITGWVRTRFPGVEHDVAPGDLGWLLRLLHEREEVLREQDGFWTLLGLLLAANGNEGSLAVSTIGKDLPTPLDAPPQRAYPRAWQALLSVGSDYWVRHALAAFPEPVLSRVRGKTDLPQTVIAGMNDPDFLDAVGAWNDSCEVPAWTSRTVPAAEREWAQLYPPEMAPGNKGFVSATTLQVFREEGAEIELFRVLGAVKAPEGNEASACEWERHLALAQPNPRKPNVVAAAWEAYPYEDNACGEIRFRAEGAEGSLTAASVWFSADRDVIYRGVPMPAFVYGFLYGLRRAEKRPPIRTSDGDEIDFHGSRFLFEHHEPDSRALYEFHAEVLSVRRVRVAGGGEILRIDLDAGTARLPCSLPVYAREGLLKDGVPATGDVVEGILFLQIDFYPFDERSIAWMKAHPDGPGPEPDDATLRDGGALVSFAKRSANGRRRIPVLDGKSGKTTEIDDDTPPPETLDEVVVALGKLRGCVGRENCLRREANPDGIDLAARTGETVHRYRVFKVLDDGPAPTDGLPDGIEPLVVRIRDTGDRYAVEYEGFPEERP